MEERDEALWAEAAVVQGGDHGLEVGQGMPRPPAPSVPVQQGIERPFEAGRERKGELLNGGEAGVDLRVCV